MWRLVLAIVLGLGSLAFTPSTLARTWTDRQGRTLTAKFVRVHGPNVVLNRAGRILVVPLSQLSPADQQYIRKKLGVEGGPSSPPSDPTDKPTTGPSPWSGPAAQDLGSTGRQGPAGDEPSSQTDESRPPIPSTVEPRTWTDVNGNTIRATLVQVTGDSVVLEREGQIRAFSRTGFCEADQQYIREVLEASRQDPKVAGPSGGSPVPAAASPAPFGSSDQQRDGDSVSDESGDDGPWSVDPEDEGSDHSAWQGRQEQDGRAWSFGSERPTQRNSTDEHSGPSTVRSRTSPQSGAPSASQETTDRPRTESRSDSSSDDCILNRPVRGPAAALLFVLVILAALTRLAWIFGLFRR